MGFAEFIVRALAFGIHDLFDGGVLHSALKITTMEEAPRVLSIGLSLVACIVIPYLLGSVNFALIISKCFFKDDVREHGSGNAGTTNVLRTYGKKAAVWTFAGDALKGVFSILIACALFGIPGEEPYYIFLVTGVYLAAFFCVLGHVFPIFAHFRGGKGFATTAGVILALTPALFAVLLILYIAMVLCSHFISLSSVVVALFWSMLLSVVDRTITGYGIGVLFAVAIGVLVTWAHRSNLRRISEGTERKFYLHKKAPAVSSAPAAHTEDDEDEE